MAAATVWGFGFFALRANPGAIISNNKADNVCDENASRANSNRGNVNREKLDLKFMKYAVFLLVAAESAARSLKTPETADHHSGPIKAAPEPATEK